jgi:hypothetical protein
MFDTYNQTIKVMSQSDEQWFEDYDREKVS